MQPSNATNTTEQLTDISNTASQAIDEVRQIAANLHPYQLDRLGLTKALKAMVRKVEGAAQIEIICNIENIDALLPPAMEINLYRIVQECLNNIFKHARATHATVQIKRHPDSLYLTIQDNGQGFAQADRGVRRMDGDDNLKAKRQNSNGGGFGLTGLSERALLLKGTLQIDSTLGEGTRISLTVPIPNQKETT